MGEPTVVGLHACGATLRRAELRRAGDRVEVLALQREPLAHGQGQTEDGQDPPPARQAGPPAGATARSGAAAMANSPAHIASMPGPDVMTRCWALPQADPARSRQMVMHRLDADLPTPMDELVWGYRRGGPASSREPTTFVLAQAARRKRVEEHVASLSQKVARIDALTTEAEALAALYRHGLELGRADGETALGDIEVLVLATEEDWLIAVLTGGVVRSVRRVPVEAARLELACQQCRQCIEAEQATRKPRRLLWCASSEMAGAHHALAERTGIPVESVAPARGLVEADGSRLSEDRLAQFGPAIGLALAGLFERDDLIRLAGREEEAAGPRYERIERILSHPWRWASAAAALLVAAFAIHVGALAWESRKLDALLEGRDEANAAMAALEPKIRAMERVQRHRIDVEGIIASICPHIPKDMLISSLQLSRERGLVLKGTVGDPKKAFELAEELRKNDRRFAQVETPKMEPARGGGFTITAELVGVERLASSSGRGGPWR